MANKHTKRALLSSVLALMLCFTMLLGTTFAWFTDSVTSENNIIKSGNLDIVLEYWDGDSWETVEGASDVLAGDKWEPGYVDTAYLRLTNAGSLALKYQLGINIVSETAGKNAAGEEFRLSDYIYFDVIEGVNGENAAYADRNAAMADVNVAKNISAGYTKAGSLVAGAAPVYLALVVYMPATVGNVANHNGTDVPQINLGINLFATQETAESDSFGPDYDVDAPIVSAPVVRPADATAMNLKGAEDVVIGLPADVVKNLPAGVTEIGLSVSEPVVDATAKTITFATIELVDQNGDVIDLDSNTTAITVTLPAQTTFAPGETVVLYHDGEYVATAIVNADTTISYKAPHLCEVSVGAVEVPEENDKGIFEISNAAQLFGFAQSVNAGNYYAGKTVVLTADIDLKNAEWTPIGSMAKEHGFMGNFDGNGYTISNLSITNIALDADGYAYAGFFGLTEGEAGAENVIKNLTIENVTINTKGHIAAAAIAYPYYTTVEDITVCGNIAISGGDYTSGVLAYTRRCTTATNISISGEKGSYITGRITVGGVISDIQTNGGIVANYSNFSASNITVTGTKNVGGISGIIGAQTLNGANVENVVLVCDDARVGIVAGAYDGKPVIKDASYSNVTGTSAIVGAPYGESSNRNLTINGVEYVGVKTGDELKAALADNKNVIFVADITMAATESNAYGKTGINVTNGQIIDGNGHTLKVTNAGGTWDSAISTTGGVIKNLTVAQGFRGIFVNHNSTHSETVVLDNVTIHGPTYTISADQGTNQGLEATNCTFNGWTSFAKTVGEAKFVDCSFGSGAGYAFCRPYAPTTFDNCEFSEGYAVDTTQATVTFTNCENPNK